MKRCTRFIVALVLCSTAAHAAVTSEQVTAVLTDGGVQLQNTGKASFANIHFPDAKRAESWLAEHLLQQTMTFEAGDADRYGRTRIISDSEEKMLRDGIAMIYASEGHVPGNWFIAEAAARSKRLGIWADNDLVVTSGNAAQHKNEFHVVEGVVTRVYEGKTGTYLNFGQDWHSDFSITIPPKLRRSMSDKLDVIKAGTHVRVRGRIYEENGPMILLGHTDNLERL